MTNRNITGIFRQVALVAIAAMGSSFFADVAATQGRDAKVTIDGNVNINIATEAVRTSASDSATGKSSTAETCIGTIGSGGADVRISGNVLINGNPANIGKCRCEGDAASCAGIEGKVETK